MDSIHALDCTKCSGQPVADFSFTCMWLPDRQRRLYWTWSHPFHDELGQFLHACNRRPRINRTWCHLDPILTLQSIPFRIRFSASERYDNLETGLLDRRRRNCPSGGDYRRINCRGRWSSCHTIPGVSSAFWGSPCEKNQGHCLADTNKRSSNRVLTDSKIFIQR